MRIWAEGADYKAEGFKDQEQLLTPAEGYLTEDGLQTFTFTFTP